MAATPILPVRVDKTTQERWKAGAADRGYADLSEFVRSCVEAELASDGAPAVVQRRETSADRKAKEREKRSGVCPHRLRPDQYCGRCDPS